MNDDNSHFIYKNGDVGLKEKGLCSSVLCEVFYEAESRIKNLKIFHIKNILRFLGYLGPEYLALSIYLLIL